MRVNRQASGTPRAKSQTGMRTPRGPLLFVLKCFLIVASSRQLKRSESELAVEHRHQASQSRKFQISSKNYLAGALSLVKATQAADGTE
jgi:hypothetical protein